MARGQMLGGRGGKWHGVKKLVKMLVKMLVKILVKMLGVGPPTPGCWRGWLM